MFLRLPSRSSFLLCLVLAVALSACTSGSSSPSDTAPAPDTAATSSADSTSPSPSPAPPPEAPSEAEANARSLSQKLSDASVEARVKQALVRTSSLRVFSFRPTVVNGHLVLRGDVNTADQYRQAERVARQVEGVEAVSNELTMGGRPVTEARLSSDEESASSDDAAVYHTVRQGDNLWDIARKYQVSVSQIQRLNDFRSSTLRPGQRIRIR